MILALTVLLTGCSVKRLFPSDQISSLKNENHEVIVRHLDRQERLNEILDDQVVAFQECNEAVLVSIVKSDSLIEELKEQSHKNTPISPKQLDAVWSRLEDDKYHVRQIGMILNANVCWSLPEFRDKLDLKVRIKGSLLELSCILFLYDFYLNTAFKVNENQQLRRLINQGDSGYGIEQDKLLQIQNLLLDFSTLHNVKNGINDYLDSKKEINLYVEGDENIAYLDQLIRTSQAFELFQTERLSKLVERVRGKRRRDLIDYFFALNREAVNGVSSAFGNFTGSYEERKGKLYENKVVEKEIASYLQSGDIILEKTPFRLTDKLIPGYWGHAAIWIGTEDELRELGIWNHRLVKQFREQIQSGKLVAESLREGTMLNSLAHFMNVDDLAVLRYAKPLSKEERAHVVLLALRQIGKSYDFNFNVETTDRIVCSQLVYLVYTDIEWPTESILGRYTISPDNIVFKVNDGVLKTSLLYVDGEKVTGNLDDVMIDTVK